MTYNEYLNTVSITESNMNKLVTFLNIVKDITPDGDKIAQKAFDMFTDNLLTSYDFIFMLSMYDHIEDETSYLKLVDQYLRICKNINIPTNTKNKRTVHKHGI